MRFQSLNQYRKRFRLKPYESFEELTGDSYYVFNSLFYFCFVHTIWIQNVLIMCPWHFIFY
nr:hypothetical protein [synthetic construct]AXG21980.1 hypothetical protein [synthetic construct]